LTELKLRKNNLFGWGIFLEGGGILILFSDKIEFEKRIIFEMIFLAGG